MDLETCKAQLEQLREKLAEEISRAGILADQLAEAERLRGEAVQLAEHQARRANRAERHLARVSLLLVRLLSVA